MEKKEKLPHKLHFILLIIVLIIGIIIRFWALGMKSLDSDESFSYFVASQKSFFFGILCMLTDLSPPLYYMFLALWIKLFGNSEFILRLPSFLVGALSIITMYVSSRKVFGRQISFGATVLVCFSPVLLLFSRIARCYSFYVLFSIISIVIWIQLINKINNNENLDLKILIKHAFFSLTVIFTHYVGILLVFFQTLYLIFFAILKKEEIKKLLITSGIVFLFSGSLLIFHYSLFHIFNPVLSRTIPHVNTGNYFIQIFNMLFYDNLWFFLAIIFFLLLNFRKVSGFISFEILINRLNSPLVYLSYIIIFPIIALVILNSHSPFLQPKHIIFIVPAVCMLISFIIYSFSSEKEYVKSIFICTLSLVFLGIYLFVPEKIEGRYLGFYNRPIQEWRESTRYILDNADKRSVILIEKARALYYTFYFEKNAEGRKKYNILVDRGLFNEETIDKKIKLYRKKYKKIYFYSPAKRKAFVDDIKDAMKLAKKSCNHLEHKNFINVNVYECY